MRQNYFCFNFELVPFSINSQQPAEKKRVALKISLCIHASVRRPEIQLETEGAPIVAAAFARIPPLLLLFHAR